jgi:hypothetical protein
VTDVDDFTKELIKELGRYNKLVKEEFEVVKKDTSKKIVKELKQRSPKQTGDYQKGWSLKKEKNGYVIYNRTDYQLTHLLEKGHAKRSGGRVPAQVHIKPIEEDNVGAFLEKIEEMVKK